MSGRSLRAGLRRLPLRGATLGMALLGLAHEAKAGDATAGKQKAQMCQTCHGLDGVARLPDVPNISGDSELYFTNQLNAFRSGQRQHEQMSVIASGLSDKDITDLAAWYSSIQVRVTVPN
jgi:cytochrome c553